MFDLIIIGMGPSGMSAAVYAKRSNLNVLILEKNTPGGLVVTTNKINNYLGLGNITGPDLAYQMFKHVKDLSIPYKIEEVLNITKENNKFKVTTNKTEYISTSVIISSGRIPKKTKFEEKTNSLKLSTCAICDAPLYKNKDVIVLGGLDTAITESIYLSKIAKTVKLILKDTLSEKQKEEILKNKNIELIENAIIDDITYEDNKYKLKLNDRLLESDGVFSYIGYTSSINYLENLGVTMDNGYIITNGGETNIKGLYASGDVTKKRLYQIVTAVSEGAQCAVLVANYIRGLEK